MKMMKKTLKLLSILAVVGAMAVACVEMPGQAGHDEWGQARNDETTAVIPGSTGDPVTLTTTVGIEASPTTKALDADGKKTFTAGEKVALIYTKSEGSIKAISEYAIQSEDIHESGKKATLSFTLTDPKEGAVTLVYPASLASTTADDGIDPVRLQNTQNGTLATLSANFDAATASDYMTVSGTSAVLSSSINLTNPLCIGEFTIKEGGDDITNKLLRLTVSDGTNQYVINRQATAGPVYVAMKPISSDKTVTVSATDGMDYYSKTVTSPTLSTLAANNMYPINVTVTKTDDRATPLTFEAVADAGAVVRFYLHSRINSAEGTVEYSTDGTNWYTYTSDNPIFLVKGEKVSFRGSKTKYDGSIFSCTDDCYIYGNVMSLVSPTGFETAQCSENATFWRLFENNTNIKNDPARPLMLPATTLTDNCYGHMFQGCTGLTLPPVLPATTLFSGCYQGMFQGCTGLTTAPELPATSLEYRCYASMFEGCSGLVAAPVLSATTMDGSCYAGMFSGCASLTAAPALPATTLVTDCYNGMFMGCTGLTVAPALPATALAEECYKQMFSGCTSLTTAPDLPATTLAEACYNQMFYGCTGLTTAPVLAAPTLVSACYDKMFQNCSNLNRVTCLAKYEGYLSCYAWLDGVAASGTFIRAAEQYWYSDPSGIPHSWTKMEDISTCTGNFTVSSGKTLTGTLANNVKISIAAGATVTLDNVSINAAGTWTTGDHAGITCLGDATIILKGTNTIKGFASGYPGIQPAHNGTGSGDEYTLTIQGSGVLEIIGSNKAAGIGCGTKSDNKICGNISITGGTVMVTGGQYAAGIGTGYIKTQNTDVESRCGNINISGGTVTATGGIGAAGIGLGYTESPSNIPPPNGTVTNSCGNITITNGVTRVTAIKGSSNSCCIGKGAKAGDNLTLTCGTITIGGTEYPDGVNPAGDTYIYPPQ